jgi:hypothetical protein
MFVIDAGGDNYATEYIYEISRTAHVIKKMIIEAGLYIFNDNIVFIVFK